MLLSIITGLIFADEKRRLVQLFPEPVRKLWNEWELRALVLISLVLQISLIYYGNRRKFIASTWIRTITWSTYLMADWVATVALGVLSNQQGNSCSCNANNDESAEHNLPAFWAPFLLLHLGGPDTITAYALADNELWTRHLLGLVVQTAVALYITLVGWQDPRLSVLTIPMLLCGIIKYGERSWALRCGSQKKFRDSVLAAQDPGPSYPKFMEEFSLKEKEGYHVTADEVIEVDSLGNDFHTFKRPSRIPDATILCTADGFFETSKFKRLFVDIMLSSHDGDTSLSYFFRIDPKTAFQVIEAELGFAYDVFYTKAPIIYTRLGFFCRVITSSFTLFVFFAFTILLGMKSWKHQLIDLIITYILLVGAFLLEAYAAISMLSSDWTNLWLSKHSKTPLFFRAISCLCLLFHKKQQRWSNSMSQYNLLSFCHNQKPVALQRISRIPLQTKLERLQGKIGDEFENMRQLRNRTEVSPELKRIIFEYFLKRSKDVNISELVSLCNSRGQLSLRAHLRDVPRIMSWTVGVEFDHSIFLWHIATDLCYHSDISEGNSTETKQEWHDHMSFSKQLADYMLYLLIMCPNMLPVEMGMITRFRDTCAEAVEFFNDKSPIADKFEACRMLTKVNTKVMALKVKGGRSTSVLFDACRLAASLQEMDRTEKWEMVTHVWVEMLGYGANKCKGYDHAQQLQMGGELLSHVWLLMAHLGITEHLKSFKGHGRARLTVE